MDRKAQTEVMIAALGMVFGLMLAPIPNLASEAFLSGILDQMDVHAARQDAGIDTVQITSPPGPQSKNFNPEIQDVLDQIRDTGEDCKSSVRPGGNRTVRFLFEFHDADDLGDGRCDQNDGIYDYAEIGRPPKISYWVKDYKDLEEDSYRHPANAIVLDPEVNSDQSS